MAYQPSNSFLLEFKNDAGTPVYAVIAGIQTRSINFNQEIVDVTNSDSVGGWRELLASAGVRSSSFSGSGVASDAAGFKELQDAFEKRSMRDSRITVPGLGNFVGPYIITSLQYNGEHHQEVKFEITLESAGAIVSTLT
jgi:TP901-1 family phage major tail protein